MKDPLPLAVAAPLGLLLLTLGGPLPWVVRRAAAGRLRRSRWVGVRTMSTTASDVGWRAGHAAARRGVEASGAAFALGGVAILLVGVMGGSTAVFLVALFAADLPAVVLLLLATVRAEEAAAAAQ